MYQLGFYNKYIELQGNILTGKKGNETEYKIEYLKQIIHNNNVYKFVSFKDTDDKIRQKVNSFKQGNIWFSYYKKLNDDTEFEIKCDLHKIARVTGCPEEYIKFVINYLTQLYDVFSLTYSYKDYMWKEYADDGNGICIIYDVMDYDFLFPIEYIDKGNVDYTQMVINAIKGTSLELAIIPMVLKNPYNKKSKLDSTKELEVRILCDPFGDSTINNGKMEYNIKDKIGHDGILKPCSEFGLRTGKVIIGDKCNDYIKNDILKYCSENNVLFELL